MMRARSVLMVLAFVALLGWTGVGVSVAPAGASIPGCLAGDVVGVAATPTGGGYWLVGADGGVFSYGDAAFYGSMGGKPLNKSVVDIVSTGSGRGYWLIAADGGVFAFGDAAAPSSNPLPGSPLNQPVVAAARSGANGLLLTAGDGGVFALGGAPFQGSMGGRPLNKPVVDIAATASGQGYWLAGSDGGIFAFGDAVSPASNPLPSGTLNSSIVALARSGTGNGLWLTAGDGGVFALGGAPFYGSAAGNSLARPVSGVASTPSGDGYWLAARDGGVFSYGSSGFFGNAVSTNCTTAPPPTATGARIVQVATDIMNGRNVAPWAGGSVPYSWGGGHRTSFGPSTGTCDRSYSGPSPCRASSTVGVDCSGLTRWVYATAYGRDVLSAGNTDAQRSRMKQVSSPQPGDLVFFGPVGKATTHVGIYVGSGKMINALKTGTNVRVDAVSTIANLRGYWRY